MSAIYMEPDLSEFEQKQFENYFDPGKAWDRYCDAEDRAYEQMMTDATCGDCDYCKFPAKRMYIDPSVSFCSCEDSVFDFIYPIDTPIEYGCEMFKPRD